VDLTTGAVVSITDEDFPEWQHDVLRLAGEILETDHYLPFRSMMTTCGMIYVTPYAIEEHFDGSKIEFRRIRIAEAWYRYRQDRFDTRRIADQIASRTRDYIDEPARTFIEHAELTRIPWSLRTQEHSSSSGCR
jgi:hypothetical protein